MVNQKNVGNLEIQPIVETELPTASYKQRRKAAGRECLRQFPDYALSFTGSVDIPSRDSGSELVISAKSDMSFEQRREAITNIVTSYEGDRRVIKIVDSFRTNDEPSYTVDLISAIEDTVRHFQPLDYKTKQLPLFWNIEHGLELYKNMDGKTDSLSEGQEEALVKLTASRQVLHLTNMRLVLHVAKKYRYIDDMMPYADILQEGNIGLLRAISLFDASKGNDFSSYACHAIESRIMIAIAEQSRNIRLPTGQHEKYLKIKKIRQDIEARSGRSASVAEIASETCMPESEVELLINSGDPQRLSIQTPLINGHEHSPSIVEFIPDSYGEVPIDKIANIDLMSRMLKQTSLTQQEKAILGLRYRLDPSYFENHSLSVKSLAQTEYGDVFDSVGIDPKCDLAKHTCIAGLFGYRRHWSQKVEKDALTVLRSEARIKGIDKLYPAPSLDEAV